MLPRVLSVLLLCSLLAGCLQMDKAPETPSPRSPYVGLETREVKALSAQEIDDLLQGRGMGFALAAELNMHPGPLHVLELREELRLTEGQEEEVLRIEAAMKREAQRLGALVVSAEIDLDRLFAEGPADKERLRELSMEIGLLRGELRAVHLTAHVDTLALLTEAQVMHYDMLRGYSGDHGGHDPSHGHR